MWVSMMGIGGACASARHGIAAAAAVAAAPLRKALRFICTSSKLVLQRELHLSRTARRAGDPAARRRVDRRVRRVEAGRVGQVEHLGPELQPARPHAELLEEREIERLVAVLTQ